MRMQPPHLITGSFQKSKVTNISVRIEYNTLLLYFTVFYCILLYSTVFYCIWLLTTQSLLSSQRSSHAASNLAFTITFIPPPQPDYLLPHLSHQQTPPLPHLPPKCLPNHPNQLSPSSPKVPLSKNLTLMVRTSSWLSQKPSSTNHIMRPILAKPLAAQRIASKTHRYTTSMARHTRCIPTMDPIACMAVRKDGANKTSKVLYQ